MKKVVALLLALSMVFVLCACGTEKEQTSTVSSAEANNKEESNIINVSKKNRTPTIYQDDNCTIRIEDLRYIEGSTDIIFVFYIENASSQVLHVNGSDSVLVDDAYIPFMFDFKKEFDAKSRVSSNHYVEKKKLEASEVTNFETVSFTVTIILGENTLAEKELIISRDAFSTNW